MLHNTRLASVHDVMAKLKLVSELSRCFNPFTGPMGLKLSILSLHYKIHGYVSLTLSLRDNVEEFILLE